MRDACRFVSIERGARGRGIHAVVILEATVFHEPPPIERICPLLLEALLSLAP